jgi:hypothetical protein
MASVSGKYNKLMLRVPLLLAILLAAVPMGWAQNVASKQPFSLEAMLRMARVADPQVSPDGLTVAFQATTVDLQANKSSTQVYVVPIAGGVPRQLTREGNNSRLPSISFPAGMGSPRSGRCGRTGAGKLRLLR